jgi:hypothetical protein
VEGLLAGLEDTFKKVSVTAAAQSGPGSDGVSDVTGRIWVARQGVHVDRIASAWLIRRFIDSAAQFKFVVRAPSPGAALGYARSGVYTCGRQLQLRGSARSRCMHGNLSCWREPAGPIRPHQTTVACRLDR